VLVWTCLAMFCGLQPRFSVTPPVFSLVTDNRRFAGSSPMVCHQSLLRHPQYRLFSTRYFIRLGVLSCFRSHKHPFRVFLILSAAAWHVQFHHSLHALSSVRPHISCRVTQYAPRPASWTAYQNELSDHALCFSVSFGVLTSTNQDRWCFRMDMAFLWLDSHR
jgi:hypothetical protein